MPDADHYWRSFHDARARAEHLRRLRLAVGDTIDQLDVETMLVHFRMFIESICVMARYGAAAHADLSKVRRKQYRPRHILDDLEYLRDVRLVGLKTFMPTPDSRHEEIGLEVVYGDSVALDADSLGELHGRLGEFAHVTSTPPDANRARDLLDDCFATYRIFAPLLARHMLEITDGPRVHDASIAGVALILGRDDLGRDWFIERPTPDRITVRLRPPLPPSAMTSP